MQLPHDRRYIKRGSLLTYITFSDDKFRKRFGGITAREFRSKLLRKGRKYMFIIQEQKIRMHLKSSNTSSIISDRLGRGLLAFLIRFSRTTDGVFVLEINKRGLQLSIVKPKPK